MKLVYIDDSPEFEEFVKRVVEILGQILDDLGIDEPIEFFFEMPNGKRDDFVYFDLGGQPIINDIRKLPLDYGISPPYLIRQSTIEKYLSEINCLFLLDVNFAPENNPALKELNKYGIHLADYLCSHGVLADYIFLFTRYEGDAIEHTKLQGRRSWFDSHSKDNWDLRSDKDAETLAYRLAHKVYELSHRTNVKDQINTDLEIINNLKENGIIGHAPSLIEAYERVMLVAPSDSTVLIHGESGTGKELIAGAIHRNSPRASHPFVKVNCSALPETLIEAELFGYEKGAFTDAHARKKGRFELAEGGTLFLDEVGEANLLTQVKLLRVLQEPEFERLGGIETIKVNVRLIAATNKDLEQAIAEGTFRNDLYYRLNVIPIILSPLRDRRDDIPLLIDFFIEKHNRKANRNVKGLKASARKLLMDYPWPGNVRQLDNEIERTVLLCKSSKIGVEDLSLGIQQAKVISNNLNLNLQSEGLKFDVITKALEQSSGNVYQVAKDLGISTQTLQSHIERLRFSNSFDAINISDRNQILSLADIHPGKALDPQPDQWSELVDLVKGGKDKKYFPQFKTLVRQSVEGNQEEELVWRIINKVIRTVCESRAVLKKHQSMRVMATFIDSLKLEKESDGALLVEKLLEPNRAKTSNISWEGLKLGEFNDQLGGSNPYSQKIEDLRSVVRTIIRKRVTLR